ncbi:MAG: hypothetical protein M3364_07885 [Actinomycetota bacterium]|nr:hypothetical protein [Actinomycetota bacterium]
MASTKTGALTTVCIAVAGCLLVLEGTAWAQTQPSPNPERLWEAFPLDPQTTAPTPPVTPAEPASPETRPAPPATKPGADADRASAIVLGGGAGVLLFLVFAGLLLRRARHRPAAAPARPETTEELIARAYALAAECDMLLASQRDKGVAAVSEIADQDSPVAQATSSSAGTSGYAEIGERVAGVLSAAETAAEQIRADARAEALELIREAKGNAEQVRQAAVTYESDTRTAVDSYASDQRRQVEQQVSKQLADAEVQARATREAAEQMARHIEEEARLRGQALREESRAVEERLKKALAGLRRMTAQLEELVGVPASAQTDGESLADALKPYGQRDEKLQPLLEER